MQIHMHVHVHVLKNVISIHNHFLTSGCTLKQNLDTLFFLIEHEKKKIEIILYFSLIPILVLLATLCHNFSCNSLVVDSLINILTIFSTTLSCEKNCDTKKVIIKY